MLQFMSIPETSQALGDHFQRFRRRQSSGTKTSSAVSTPASQATPINPIQDGDVQAWTLLPQLFDQMTETEQAEYLTSKKVMDCLTRHYGPSAVDAMQARRRTMSNDNGDDDMEEDQQLHKEGHADYNDDGTMKDDTLSTTASTASSSTRTDYVQDLLQQIELFHPSQDVSIDRREFAVILTIYSVKFDISLEDLCQTMSVQLQDDLKKQQESALMEARKTIWERMNFGFVSKKDATTRGNKNNKKNGRRRRRVSNGASRYTTTHQESDDDDDSDERVAEQVKKERLWDIFRFRLAVRDLKEKNEDPSDDDEDEDNSSKAKGAQQKNKKNKKKKTSAALAVWDNLATAWTINLNKASAAEDDQASNHSPTGSMHGSLHGSIHGAAAARIDPIKKAEEEAAALHEAWSMLPRLFDIWDVDCSGNLDQAEIFAGVEHYCEAYALDFDSRIITEIFQQVDSNDDQQLDRREFAAFLERFANEVQEIELGELAWFMMDQLMDIVLDDETGDEDAVSVLTMSSSTPKQASLHQQGFQSNDRRMGGGGGGLFFGHNKKADGVPNTIPLEPKTKKPSSNGLASMFLTKLQLNQKKKTYATSAMKPGLLSSPEMQLSVASKKQHQPDPKRDPNVQKVRLDLAMKKLRSSLTGGDDDDNDDAINDEKKGHASKMVWKRVLATVQASNGEGENDGKPARNLAPRASFVDADSQ